MFEIKWQQLTTGLFTCTHGNWTFKKLITKTHTIYSIWRDEEMKFSTRIEHEFINKASGAMSNAPEWWWR
jgi:hypothetical protein